jgi:hypothetical protein
MSFVYLGLQVGATQVLPFFAFMDCQKRHVTGVIVRGSGRCTEGSTNRKQRIGHCPQCDDPNRGDNFPAAEGRHLWVSYISCHPGSAGNAPRLLRQTLLAELS